LNARHAAGLNLGELLLDVVAALADFANR